MVIGPPLDQLWLKVKLVRLSQWFGLESRGAPLEDGLLAVGGATDSHTGETLKQRRTRCLRT